MTGEELHDVFRITVEEMGMDVDKGRKWDSLMHIERLIYDNVAAKLSIKAV